MDSPPNSTKPKPEYKRAHWFVISRELSSNVRHTAITKFCWLFLLILFFLFIYLFIGCTYRCKYRSISGDCRGLALKNDQRSVLITQRIFFWEILPHILFQRSVLIKYQMFLCCKYCHNFFWSNWCFKHESSSRNILD